MVPGFWKGGKPHAQDFSVGKGGIRRTRVGKAVGDWQCGSCAYLNFARNWRCLSCGNAPHSPTYSKVHFPATQWANTNNGIAGWSSWIGKRGKSGKGHSLVQQHQQHTAKSPFAEYARLLKEERDAVRNQWKWCRAYGSYPGGWWRRDKDGTWIFQGKDYEGKDKEGDVDGADGDDDAESGEERKTQWKEESTPEKEARLERSWLKYNGRWNTLQALKQQGERWGDPTYDTAWSLYEEARIEYSAAKPPLPRGRKLELLHGDVARAEDALAKASERVEEAQRWLQDEEDKRERAQEKLERQKERLAEHCGGDGDEVQPNDASSKQWDYVRPFATNARAALDECGSVLLQMQECLRDGNHEAQQQHIELLFSRLGTVRDDAYHIEQEVAEDLPEDDASSWENDWWQEPQVQTEKGGARNTQDHYTPQEVWYHGKFWESSNEKQGIFWDGRYWTPQQMGAYQGDRATAQAVSDARVEAEVARAFGYSASSENDDPSTGGAGQANNTDAVADVAKAADNGEERGNRRQQEDGQTNTVNKKLKVDEPIDGNASC